MTEDDLFLDLKDRAVRSDDAAIAYALLKIAIQLKWLGNGDAAGPFGAIEGHAVHLGEKITDFTSAIDSRLDSIVAALEELKPGD